MQNEELTANVRLCTPTDAEMLGSLGARLFVQAYGPTHPEPEQSRYLARTYSREAMLAAIEQRGSFVLVAEDSGGSPIGYAHIAATEELPDGVEGTTAFEIVRFYVDAAQQGRGVGAALMASCCEIAKDWGADMIWLQTWSQAPWAVGFYRRMGFTIVGKKPFYFGERVDQDHVMSRPL
jgi:GNAT superfamily N-acetyltransferase